eukprot:640291-Rhodomonas_salina.1
MAEGKTRQVFRFDLVSGRRTCIGDWDDAGEKGDGAGKDGKDEVVFRGRKGGREEGRASRQRLPRVRGQRRSLADSQRPLFPMQRDNGIGPEGVKALVSAIAQGHTHPACENFGW